MPEIVLNHYGSTVDPTKGVDQVLNYSNVDNVLKITDVVVTRKFGKDGDQGVTSDDIDTFFAENISDGQALKYEINSKGGDVGQGLRIYNRIKNHSGDTTSVVTGYAMSTAGWLAQAADKRLIVRNGMFMMHDPMMCPPIKSEECLSRVANQWKLHRDEIADILSQRSGMDVEEVKNAMRAETWMNGREAVEAGFFDDIYDGDGDYAALNYCPVESLPERFSELLEKPVTNASRANLVELLIKQQEMTK